MPFKWVFVYNWIIPVTASRKLILIISNSICSDSKRTEKITHFSKKCPLVTENKKNECVIGYKSIFSCVIGKKTFMGPLRWTHSIENAENVLSMVSN